ncbi:hypothetical protein H5410_052902 [Solanum commersonii]|uniref:Leucine-rich repeat-containing N-terminal plant-type domain-containing protein n=1 Tax=Solanum commersonii TaxID=4109 RepID=A0A9J5X2D3_SOLCO|nr:hypothetical protein H5410_052902 [Solanum commersonii]
MKILLLLQVSFITILVVFSNYTSGQCLEDQTALLIKFKNNLTFDSSDSTKLAMWDENSTDCCQWPGVSCDEEGHVLALELDDEAISGGIENLSSLFHLRYLEKLNLAYNGLYSVPIPREIYKLANLMYLNLFLASFNGQIPMELSRLTKLEILDLSGGDLQLERPGLKTLVGNLANLRELYLDSVSISLKGSEWCSALSSSLPQLRVLSMIDCKISGPLDPVLLNLPFLSVIRLDYNDLSTMVPDFLANFTKLTTLSVSWCKLFGPFPSKLFQVPTLEELDLLGNENLTGTLPEFPHKSALRELSLGETCFTGLLPVSIADLPCLTMLDLHNCNFSGPIPSTMGNLTNLVSLDLSKNSFTGSIPLFHEANNFYSIDISNNNGPLSSAQLGDLLSLPSLHNNYLNGSIPRSIFKLSGLSNLSLSSNSFSGTINIHAVKGLPSLSILDLSYNNLRIDVQGSNSTSFPFPQITELKLVSCQLQKFPDLKNQSIMITLDLSDNNISGQVPSWIWSLGLSYLNLSCNFIESLEEPYDTSSQFWSVIDLHNNRIQGNIPIVPTSLIYLSIASNNHIGSIPSFICNLNRILFLDMSNNSINNKLPPCLC